VQTLDLTDVMLPHERHLCQVCNRVRDPETELSEEPEMTAKIRPTTSLVAPLSNLRIARDPNS